MFNFIPHLTGLALLLFFRYLLDLFILSTLQLPFTLLISFFGSSIMFPPLATRPSISSLFILFCCHPLFGINQPSLCGLALRLHYALPLALIFIS